MDHDSEISDAADKPGALIRTGGAQLARPKPRVLVYPRESDVFGRPRMKTARIWTRFWSRRKLIAIGFLSGILAAAGTSWFIKSEYRAAALISAGHAVDVTLPGFETIASTTSDDEYFSSQLELLLSAKVADAAIRSGAATQDPEFVRLAGKRRFAPSASQIDDILSSSIRRRLIVTPHREARSAEIQFRSQSAAGAAAVANAIAEAYLAASSGAIQQKLTGISSKLSERSFDLANRAADAREKLLSYGRLHPGTAQHWRAQTQTGQASQINQQIFGAAAEQKDVQEKIARLRAAGSQSELADISPSLAQIRAELAKAESELAVMQGKYSPDYPPMKAAIGRVASEWQKFETQRASDLAALQREYNAGVAQESTLKDQLSRPAAVAASANPRSAEYALLVQDYERASDQYQGLQRALGYMEVLTGLPLNQSRFIDPAKPPARPAGPQRWQHIVAGALAGLFAGMIVAWIQTRGSQKISNPDDVELASGLGTVGIIPKFEKLREAAAATVLAAEQKRGGASIPGAVPLSCDPQFIAESQIDEAFNRLRASLFSPATHLPPRVLLVTSAHSGEGKTTVAIKTAMSLARASLRVVLIDCDLRRPTVHKVLGMAGRTGVATFLATPMDEIWPLVNECRVSDSATLHVIPAGDPVSGAGDLVATTRLRDFIEALRSIYDFVVIDSPPMSGMSDALVMSNFVDSVLLVAQGERTTAEDLRRVCIELDQMNANIFGVVLSQVDVLASKYYQAYYPSDTTHFSPAKAQP